MKTKRKELDDEDVYDDFADFSLSSPARKIRRLDAELPPIIEEGERVPLDLDLDLDLDIDLDLDPPSASSFGAETEEQMTPLNEERAIVLYKPVVENSLWQSPNISITVDEDLISPTAFRKEAFWYAGRSGLLKLAKDQLESEDNNGDTKHCLAVVPWAPYQPPSAPEVDSPAVIELSDPMEADAMEIEDDLGTMASEEQSGKTNGWGEGEGLQQWQQQHCMTLQFPSQTETTPVMWSL